MNYLITIRIKLKPPITIPVNSNSYVSVKSSVITATHFINNYSGENIKIYVKELLCEKKNCLEFEKFIILDNMIINTEIIETLEIRYDYNR